MTSVKWFFSPQRVKCLSVWMSESIGAAIYSYEPSFQTHSTQCCPLKLWFISLWPGEGGRERGRRETIDVCVCVKESPIVSWAGMWENVCHWGRNLLYSCLYSTSLFSTRNPFSLTRVTRTQPVLYVCVFMCWMHLELLYVLSIIIWYFCSSGAVIAALISQLTLNNNWPYFTVQGVLALGLSK